MVKFAQRLKNIILFAKEEGTLQNYFQWYISNQRVKWKKGLKSLENYLEGRCKVFRSNVLVGEGISTNKTMDCPESRSTAWTPRGGKKGFAPAYHYVIIYILDTAMHPLLPFLVSLLRTCANLCHRMCHDVTSCLCLYSIWDGSP